MLFVLFLQLKSRELDKVQCGINLFIHLAYLLLAVYMRLFQRLHKVLLLQLELLTVEDAIHQVALARLLVLEQLLDTLADAILH